MRIAQMFSPVHSLGPGDRVCLWTQGCKKNCKGCISPEMQPELEIDVNINILKELLCGAARKGNCSGITISGGDPLEQPDELLDLLKLIRNEFENILVYTGFTLEEIEDGVAGKSAVLCLKYIDVLIDGRYIDEENVPDAILRGSMNQQIHYLNPVCRNEYEEYMKKGRVIEPFFHDGKIVFTGILNRD